MNSLDDLERQARALSTAERALLAELLLESIQPPVSTVEADWNREIEARVAAFDRGEVSSQPAADVFAEARRLVR